MICFHHQHIVYETHLSQNLIGVFFVSFLTSSHKDQFTTTGLFFQQGIHILLNWFIWVIMEVFSLNDCTINVTEVCWLVIEFKPIIGSTNINNGVDDDGDGTNSNILDIFYNRFDDGPDSDSKFENDFYLKSDKKSICSNHKR